MCYCESVAASSPWPQVRLCISSNEFPLRICRIKNGGQTSGRTRESRWNATVSARDALTRVSQRVYCKYCKPVFRRELLTVVTMSSHVSPTGSAIAPGYDALDLVRRGLWVVMSNMVCSGSRHILKALEASQTMKATGIVRRVDRLGRIVLPVGLRLQLRIDEDTLLEVCRNNHFMVLAKHEKGCVFCGATEALAEHRGKLVCASRMAEMAQVGHRE